MGILSITTFVSLDGVMQAPGGATEDTAGGFAHGGWVIPHFDAPMGAFMSEVFSRAGAFLLGRGTYEIFASHWPKVTDPDDPIAGPLNRLPKYVASRSLAQADWAGSTVVRDPVAELAGLTAGLDGELQVHGSAGLAASLLRAGVVDALNLLTFPVVLGAGKRLFPNAGASAAWALVAHSVSPGGVVMARYRRSGAVPQAEAPPPT
jgi:dihydrofolate reductase